jgi:2-aminoadipate transaminase
MDYQRFLSPTGRQLHESAIRRMGTVVAGSADVVSFAPGYPDPSAFPWDDLREIANRRLSGSDLDVLQYGPTRGFRPLIEALVSVLSARHITATPEEILITTGSQQGLDLVAKVMVSPGDAVLVELPAYTGAISAFRNARGHLVGVKQEADGIDLEDLDEVCLRERSSGRRVNLLYLVPNFQNPTGSLLARAKRRRLLDWAERRDVLIVEDDPYGSLYFEDVASIEDTRAIRADDHTGRVIYLSSVSKTLAPGFRVGWMLAPESLIDRFETAKQSVDLATGSLDQRIVLDALRAGIIERIAPQLRMLYRQKRDAMQAAFAAEIGEALRWPQPKGGFFLWATLPEGCDDRALLTHALAQGLVFVTGSAFFVDGSGHDRIRLSFATPTVARIQEGAKRLAAALRESLAQQHAAR